MQSVCHARCPLQHDLNLLLRLKDLSPTTTHFNAHTRTDQARHKGTKPCLISTLGCIGCSVVSEDSTNSKLGEKPLPALSSRSTDKIHHQPAKYHPNCTSWLRDLSGLGLRPSTSSLVALVPSGLSVAAEQSGFRCCSSEKNRRGLGVAGPRRLHALRRPRKCWPVVDVSGDIVIKTLRDLRPVARLREGVSMSRFQAKKRKCREP